MAHLNIPTSKKRTLKYISILIAVVSVVSSFLWLYRKIQPTQASYSHNNNTGTFTIDFADTTGLSSTSDSLTFTGGLAQLKPTQTSGDFTTINIIPSSSGGWQELQLEGTWGTIDAITAQILTCTGTPLPDTILPGNSTGLELSAQGTLDLSPIPTITTCLRAKITLNDPTGETSPTLSQLTVTWLPRTVYLISLNPCA